MKFSCQLTFTIGAVVALVFVSDHEVRAQSADPFDPNASAPTAPQALKELPAPAPTPVPLPPKPVVKPLVAKPIEEPVQTQKKAAQPEPRDITITRGEKFEPMGKITKAIEGLFDSDREAPVAPAEIEEESKPTETESPAKEPVKSEPKIAKPVEVPAPEVKAVEVKAPKEQEPPEVAPKAMEKVPSGSQETPREKTAQTAPDKPGLLTRLNNRLVDLFNDAKSAFSTPQPKSASKVEMALPAQKEAENQKTGPEEVKPAPEQEQPQIAEPQKRELTPVREVEPTKKALPEPKTVEADTPPLPVVPKPVKAKLAEEPKAEPKLEAPAAQVEKNKEEPGFLSKLGDQLKEIVSNPTAQSSAPSSTPPQKVQAPKQMQERLAAPETNPNYNQLPTVALKKERVTRPSSGAAPLMKIDGLSAPSEALRNESELKVPSEALVGEARATTEKTETAPVPKPDTAPEAVVERLVPVEEAIQAASSDAPSPFSDEAPSPIQPEEVEQPSRPGPVVQKTPEPPMTAQPETPKVDPQPEMTAELTPLTPKEEDEKPGFFSNLTNRLGTLFEKSKPEEKTAPSPATSHTSEAAEVSPPPEAPKIKEPVLQAELVEEEAKPVSDTPEPTAQEAVAEQPTESTPEVLGSNTQESKLVEAKGPAPAEFKPEPATRLRDEEPQVKLAADVPQEEDGFFSKISDGLKTLLDDKKAGPAEEATAPTVTQVEASPSPKAAPVSDPMVTTEESSPFHPAQPSPIEPEPRFEPKLDAPEIKTPNVETALKKSENPSEELEKPRTLKITREEEVAETPESEGFFSGLTNKISDLFTPPTMERMIKKEDAKQKEKEKPNPILSASKPEPEEKEQAALPPPQKPVLTTSPAFMAANLGLGKALPLGGMRQQLLKGQKAICVEKRKNAKHYCLVKANWPKNLNSHFDISNVVYRGTKGMVLFEEERATRFYALFPTESFNSLVSHYRELYGEPAFKTSRKVRTLARGTATSKIVQWRRQEKGGETFSVLELRQVDDVRSNLPDLDYGVFRVYYEGSPEIFSAVSTLDFFDMN